MRMLAALSLLTGALAGPLCAQEFSLDASSTTRKLKEDLEAVAQAADQERAAEASDALFDGKDDRGGGGLVVAMLSAARSSAFSAMLPAGLKTAAVPSPAEKAAVKQCCLEELQMTPDGTLYRAREVKSGFLFWRKTTVHIEKGVADADGAVFNDQGEFVGQWNSVLQAKTKSFRVVQSEDGAHQIYTMQKAAKGTEISRNGQVVTTLEGQEGKSFKIGADDKIYALTKEGSDDVVVSIDPMSKARETVAKVTRTKEWQELIPEKGHWDTTGHYEKVPGKPGFYRTVPGRPGHYETQRGTPGFYEEGPGRYRTVPGEPGYYSESPGRYRTVPGKPGRYETVPGTPGHYHYHDGGSGGYNHWHEGTPSQQVWHPGTPDTQVWVPGEKVWHPGTSDTQVWVPGEKVWRPGTPDTQVWVPAEPDTQVWVPPVPDSRKWIIDTRDWKVDEPAHHVTRTGVVPISGLDVNAKGELFTLREGDVISEKTKEAVTKSKGLVTDFRVVGDRVYNLRGKTLAVDDELTALAMSGLPPVDANGNVLVVRNGVVVRMPAVPPPGEKAAADSRSSGK
ncbi:MAG: hypothetical protein HY554_17940 [Elusimicrobia bacterium]|nr:hypothetical protein [Elusimicrobiota bacterium]